MQSIRECRGRRGFFPGVGGRRWAVYNRNIDVSSVAIHDSKFHMGEIPHCRDIRDETQQQPASETIVASATQTKQIEIRFIWKKQQSTFINCVDSRSVFAFYYTQVPVLPFRRLSRAFTHQLQLITNGLVSKLIPGSHQTALQEGYFLYNYD